MTSRHVTRRTFVRAAGFCATPLVLRENTLVLFTGDNIGSPVFRQ